MSSLIRYIFNRLTNLPISYANLWLESDTVITGVCNFSTQSDNDWEKIRQFLPECVTSAHSIITTRGKNQTQLLPECVTSAHSLITTGKNQTQLLPERVTSAHSLITTEEKKKQTQLLRSV